MDKLLIIFLCIIFIILAVIKISKFTPLYPQDCKKNDRYYPQGKVPGSYLGLNKFEINCEQVALSDENGTAKMYMFKDKLNYMTSINSNRYEGNPDIIQGKEIVEVEVPLERFSVLFDKYKFPSLDLIKIDVEGHEVQILSSMISLIEQFRPNILVEILSDEVATSLNLIFKDLGYYYIEIDEVNMPKLVSKLNDNHHHNYLLCNEITFAFLCDENFIQY